MKKLFTFLSFIISLNCFGQIGFEEHVVIGDSNTTHGASSVYASDIDGDGDMDLVSASSFDNKITWYENTNARGAFGAQQVITLKAYQTTLVFASDLDGDGDMDILSDGENKLVWYENINGLGKFGSRQIISTHTSYATKIHTADIDNDGDLDLLAAYEGNNKIVWYENTNGLGKFGKEQIILTLEYASSIYTSDIDNDGDLDVLSASKRGYIAWHENIDGKGKFKKPNIISTNLGEVTSVFTGDIDGDGDMDVFSSSYNLGKITWYENMDGLGSFSQQKIVATDSYYDIVVITTDIDNDGDLDVLSASRRAINWHENTDGKGSFGEKQKIVFTDLANSIFPSDLDNDGDIDIAYASINNGNIAWIENVSEHGEFGKEILVTREPKSENLVYPSDIDGDGDLDLIMVTEYDGKIFWYKNIDGYGNFEEQKTITTSAHIAISIFPTDLDGDGDIDILSASEGFTESSLTTSYHKNNIAWYENLDGLGNFGKRQAVTYLSRISLVYADDLDNDGDMDILAGQLNTFSKKITWYENNNSGTFGKEQIITKNADFVNSIFTTDIDGDKDLDVLSVSIFDDKIAWYENTNGLGKFGKQNIISENTNQAVRVYACDIDSDGDMDVLSVHASPYNAADNKLVWYENINSCGSFGEQQIISLDVNLPQSICASDIDGDGDLDVLSASSKDHKIAWYENTNGKGSFGKQQIISTTAFGAWLIFSKDLDQDGDMDILLAAGSKIVWYENLRISKK